MVLLSTGFRLHSIVDSNSGIFLARYHADGSDFIFGTGALRQRDGQPFNCEHRLGTVSSAESPRLDGKEHWLFFGTGNVLTERFIIEQSLLLGHAEQVGPRSERRTKDTYVRPSTCQRQ